MEPILLFLSAFPCALFDASLFPFPPSLWEFYFELMRMGSTLGRGEVGEDGRVGRQWTTQIFDFIRDLFDDRETLEGEKGGLIVTVLARFVHRCGDHFDGEIERTACFRFVTDIMRKVWLILFYLFPYSFCSFFYFCTNFLSSDSKRVGGSFAPGYKYFIDEA